jgi:hypothetical protein
MNTRTLGSGMVAATTSMLLGGASPHGAIARGGGNAPNPAAAAQGLRSACAPLPDKVTPVAGLLGAWAIEQPSSSVRLLFADHALACLDPNWHRDQPGIPCIESWRFALTIPIQLLTPGVYNLNEYEVDFAEEITRTGPSGGCGSGACTSHGTAGATRADGTIQIDDVSASCITGRILRLVTGSPDDPDFTGGFQAPRCTPPQD